MTFFMGIVLQRNIEFLKQRKVIVVLLENEKPLFKTSFTMIESKIFFEPYECSMEVLKNMYSHNFPMEKYIIKACNEIDYPNYIGELPEPYYYGDITTKEELGFDRLQYQHL